MVITGNGKGKTTAAIGQTIRALGGGKKVFFAQFIKSDGYPSGEDEVLRHAFGDRVVFLKGGRGFVGILGDKLPFAEHREAAQKTLAAAKEAAASGVYDLVILDEVNVAMALKLIDRAEVEEVIDLVPEGRDIVLTGRAADTAILKRAALVTECVEIKHPYQEQVKAKKGIEY
jgi:cob(I)alamin adenosyltransferase